MRSQNAHPESMKLSHSRIAELNAEGGPPEVARGIGRFIYFRKHRLWRRIQNSWNALQLRYIAFKNGGGSYIKEINGSLMELDISSHGPTTIDQTLALDGIREPGATKQYQEFLKGLQSRATETIHVVDIGANVGYFALMAAEILKEDGHVYGIEADPENTRRLNRNIQLNEYNNIDAFQFAAGAERTVSRLKLRPSSNLHRMVDVIEDKEAVETVDVDVHPVDDLVRKWGIPGNDCLIIRMDVEGYESFVLDGMTKLLESNRPMGILMEIHPNLEAVDIGEIQHTLRRCGFEPEYISHDGGKTYSAMDSLSEISTIESNGHILVSRLDNLE